MSAVTRGELTVRPRPGADVAMRRLLRVPDGGRPSVRDEDAHRLFSTSMLISAVRCLLGYVIFPLMGPVIGASGVAPAIGIPIGLLALVFDVRGIRRFWLADHRWRWPITGIYLAVMVLVTILLVRDLVHIF
jgi:hypothetical protein